MNSSLLSKVLSLFPDGTHLETNAAPASLAINRNSLSSLAEAYGTPLYIYDQATLDQSVSAYRHSLQRHYPGEAGITYAGKAFLCLAMAQWVHRQNLWLDCTGVGELSIATAAGLPREQILVHGVSKNAADLEAALHQARTIVVDNLMELQRLADAWGMVENNRITRSDPSLPQLWLRLRPGFAVDTHAYRQTGQGDSKFGMAPEEVLQAVELCLQRDLPLTGLHFHQGSHFNDPQPLGAAIDVALDILEAISGEFGWQPESLSPGGGWGVAYHPDELPHPPLDQYIAFLSNRVVSGCQKRRLSLPRLQIEPGRSIVARAGVAVYRVVTVKKSATRRWLLLDGGMADNPRPALYGARYSALPVCDPGRPEAGNAWLAGPYCESGDILIQDLPMPEIEPGELIAIPVSGAYHLSMGSNYNGARKPAVVWLANQTTHLIQRRESLTDLLQRDLPLPPDHIHS